MKQFFLVCTICLLSGHLLAQKTNTDSLAYQLQRAKINGMLDQRREKFGQYDVSMAKHTGIFGLQTKKDIRRSNDILMDIVKTDDDIFRELKVLMDYRVFQQQLAQSHSTRTENVNLAFMNTINRLRQQTELLKQEAQNEREHQEKIIRFLVILIVLMLGSILYLSVKKRAVNT